MLLTTTNLVWLVCIIGYLLFACYDSFLSYHFKGKTKLLVRLRTKSWFDGILNLIILATLCYYAITQSSFSSFNWFLLTSLIVIGLYHFFIRKHYIHFKDSGFIYSSLYMPHQEIASINMNQQGLLEIQFKHRKGIVIDCYDLKSIKEILSFYMQLGLIEPRDLSSLEENVNDQTN